METSPDAFGPFAAALLDPSRPAPPGLAAWNGSDPAVRFAVYRNNVVASLVEALAETFPVTRTLAGEDFFRWMARQFVMAEPPRSPVLAEYGAGFPAFIAAFARAAGLGHLPDVARLEHLRVRAYQAADAEPLPTARLARELEHPERLPAAHLELHPSVQVLCSSQAVVSLWAAHQGETIPAGSDLDHPESALVLRSAETLAVLPVSPAAAAFVAALADGASLGEATGAGVERDPGFDPTHSLALLIRHGAIVAWQSPGDQSP